MGRMRVFTDAKHRKAAHQLAALRSLNTPYVLTNKRLNVVRRWRNDGLLTPALAAELHARVVDYYNGRSLVGKDIDPSALLDDIVALLRALSPEQLSEAIRRDLEASARVIEAQRAELDALRGGAT